MASPAMEPAAQTLSQIVRGHQSRVVGGVVVAVQLKVKEKIQDIILQRLHLLRGLETKRGVLGIKENGTNHLCQADLFFIPESLVQGIQHVCQ